MKWDDVEPDFRWYPVSELCSQMDLAANCWLLGGIRATSVVIASDIHAQIYAHLGEKSVEMGGLLLGRAYGMASDQGRVVVHVTKSTRATSFQGTAVSLRMDTDVWSSASAASEEGEFIVGWYHSHPNLGVFFSGTDRKTQKSFFDTEYSLGLVIDPVRDEELWFFGGDSQQLNSKSILKY
ncbi:Mov34/MPN/PAD-1 family protein [Pseudooceanicola sp. LIPI14-2-Ac024]|uniref:Mov34/MPN/PAD-1 family protein n=1 Tax=Pseudooceanicola sp. LIPI14-2-Ac024 TaxID=3344875 RepID=UPI0035D122D2